MKLFGFELKRVTKALSPTSGRWQQIFDYNTGYWQQDTAIELDSVLTNSTVFACIRLIATDIGKMRIKLVQQDSGIWREFDSPSFSPVLRKPNSFQTRIKFIEYWVQSKLQFGNTYVLKSRDNRGVVVGLRVMDPTRVTPLISDSGEVFYRLRSDNLSRITIEVTVPATEVIHDVHMTPEHPLVGVSPIGACGLAATQGLKIQGNSTKLFTNMSRPAGILTAPGNIADATAARLKTTWETNYGGDNYGKTAVLGDGLTYVPVATNAVDNQLIEQLRWTSEDVCRAFGVPAYKVGVGPMPAYNNIEALNTQYYSETLQELIECIELLLDEGMELPKQYGTEFDLDGLLRMDSMTYTQVLKEQIGSGLLAPDEGRAKLGYGPVPGGEYPYLQQQNYSLEALAKRDASTDPFGTAKPEPEPEPDEDEDEDDDDEDETTEEERQLLAEAMLRKELAA
jgi:HK97 family phage portal protein